MRRIIGFLLVSASIAAAQDRPAPFADAERKLFDAANAARVKESLDKLTVNRTLTQVARQHAENMAKQEKMAHVLDGKGVGQRTADAGYDYMVVGENLAKAEGAAEAPAPAASEIHDNWMKSEGHRKNLLNPKFTEVGMAVVKSEKGTYFYCQVFATKLK